MKTNTTWTALETNDLTGTTSARLTEKGGLLIEQQATVTALNRAAVESLTRMLHVAALTAARPQFRAVLDRVEAELREGRTLDEVTGDGFSVASGLATLRQLLTDEQTHAVIKNGFNASGVPGITPSPFFKRGGRCPTCNGEHFEGDPCPHDVK